MPTTKAKSSQKTSKRAGKNGMPDMESVLTLTEAATYLRVRAEDLVQMARTQGLPGRQIGGEWRFLKSALERWLSDFPASSSKHALLALAGKFKDDPYLDEITRKAYRRRAQATGEGAE